MPVPEVFFSALQNGGFMLVVTLLIPVVLFTPLIYVAVLTDGASHKRLVKIIRAVSGMITALKTTTRHK